jgi:hypothetical protein
MLARPCPRSLRLLLLGMASSLQAQNNELERIRAEFFRSAADRVANVQAEMTKYTICACGAQ